MKARLFPLLVLLGNASFSQIVISEVQSSNASTIADQMGEYEDWVKLRNAGTATVEVGGMVLKDQLDTWAIPIGDTATV
jgi:hypothetical protein